MEVAIIVLLFLLLQASLGYIVKKYIDDKVAEYIEAKVDVDAVVTEDLKQLSDKVNKLQSELGALKLKAFVK
jgi:ABC-type bacteriocin/lantibiotic exporter with double-glycine peptidase domain